MVSRWPDFFIVGAPKTGTTSLWGYLYRHPKVFMASRREGHFFATDLTAPDGAFIRDEEEYLDLFEEAGDADRVGEKSVFYLLSERAAKEIHKRVPDARIIIMLRDPVEMLYSFHSQRVQSGNEDIPDFGEALAAEEDRRRGQRIPRGVWAPTALQYRRLGRYADQVQRYLNLFGEEQIHVVIFDDLVQDTPGTYRSVLEFLDVGPDDRTEFKVANPNRNIRFFRLHRFLHAPPEPLERFARRYLPRDLLRRVVKKARWLNLKTERRPPMDPEIRRALAAELRPDVERLATLIGRDLGHWCRTEGEERTPTTRPSGSHGMTGDQTP